VPPVSTTSSTAAAKPCNSSKADGSCNAHATRATYDSANLKEITRVRCN
jgi:hypothetical protein